MRITDFRVIPIAFADPPLRNSTGVHQPVAIRTLVRLETNNGLVGWGETYGGSQPLRDLSAVADYVLGSDPREPECLAEAIPNPRTFSAVEVACLDLAGQDLGVPVSVLLGGRRRERVDFSAYLFYHLETPAWGECLTPESMLVQARRLVDAYGFRSLKLKGGVLPPDQEIETIQLLQSHFGADFKLRLDPNAIWSVETSVRVGLALPNLEYLEDPTEGRSGMAEVKSRVQVPLSTNMCVTAFEHFPEAIELGSVDVVLSDHHYWGGLRATRDLAAVCRTWGLGLSMHSNSHTGISLAAMLHAASATPHLTYACDTHYVWLEEDLLVGGKIPFDAGFMQVPTGTGLGIHVDEDRVSEWEEEYHRHGITVRDDVTEMRKYDPHWEPLRPRW